MSLPSRECGLKSSWNARPLTKSSVTPFAGVWIEICSAVDNVSQSFVTPFAGVWIEMILNLPLYGILVASLPSRECGLKLELPLQIRQSDWSLPSRECGLKSYKRQDASVLQLSLPSRECGLKSSEFLANPPAPFVTPFAGVWIEIMYLFADTPAVLSLPSRECGLKYLCNNSTDDCVVSLPSRECGLKYVSDTI